MMMFASLSISKAEVYEPYVSNPSIEGKLLYPGGGSSISFVVGNSGDLPLKAIGESRAHSLRMVLTLSRLKPKGDAIEAISGEWRNYFDITYSSENKTYQFIQKAGALIPEKSYGIITIKVEVESESNEKSKQNGFNVNIQPPAYTNGYQSTSNDAVNIFTNTVRNISSVKDIKSYKKEKMNLK